MIHWLAHKLGLKSCPACETLVDYAMDGLESPQQEKVRQHLSDCPSCMEQVRDFMEQRVHAMRWQQVRVDENVVGRRRWHP